MFIVFENISYKRFKPLTDFAPLFLVRAGLYSWAHYIKKKFPQSKVKLHTKRELINEKYGLDRLDAISSNLEKEVVTYLDGRIIPNAYNYQLLKKIRQEKQKVTLVDDNGDLLLHQTQNRVSKDFRVKFSPDYLPSSSLKSDGANPTKLEFFDNIFDLVKFFPVTFSEHLKELENEVKKKSHKDWREIQEKIYSQRKFTLPQNVTWEVEKGPIFLGEKVKIEPWVHLVGPLYLSKGVQVKSQSRLAGSYLGRQAKVAGEIDNSLVGSFSNKNHHGFIGNSIIGSWVNLGAGATTSNLKNTYGNIKGELMDEKETIDTKAKFLGSVLGDFAKVGINVSLYAGKLIGLGANVVGNEVKNNVPNFSFDQTKKNFWEINSFLKMAKRMGARRGVDFFSPKSINERIIRSIHPTKN